MSAKQCTHDGECAIPGHTVLYRTAEWNPPPLHGQKITTWREHHEPDSHSTDSHEGEK